MWHTGWLIPSERFRKVGLWSCILRQLLKELGDLLLLGAVISDCILPFLLEVLKSHRVRNYNWIKKLVEIKGTCNLPVEQKGAKNKRCQILRRKTIHKIKFYLKIIHHLSLHVHVHVLTGSYYMYMYVVVPQDGDTALLCACWHGFQPIVECLVESGSSLWIRNKDGDTAVHVAAVRGYYTIVRFLCKSGADIDAVNQVCI